MANASGYFGGARIQPSKPLAAATLNRMQDATQSGRARSGVGCLTRWTPAGTIVTPLPARRGRSGARARHPFQVIREADTDSDVPQVSVHVDSWLMESLKVDSKITMTGLGFPFEFPAEPNKLIYVKVTFGPGGAVASASLEHGAPWDSYPEPLGNSGTGPTERQEFAYALVAHTRTIDEFIYSGRIALSDTVEIAQDWHTNMRLCRDCYNGNDSARLIVPHGAPGPVIAD